MADCGSLDDALGRRGFGADIIGTTLAGYTGEREPTDGPDLELISAIRDAGLRSDARRRGPHPHSRAGGSRT
jgi:N-acylglucosamine-6-phosphate 2-epimerase